MTALEPPYSHFVSAAEGWLELGNIDESWAELERIEEAFREHPTVLEVKWAICAQTRDWPAALKIAKRLVQIAPESHFGWLHQAYALRRVSEGGLQSAWDFLLPVLRTFPKVPLIPYNLACYACQMGNLERARELLQRTLTVGDKQRIKQIAMGDDDLLPLRREIEKW
jgi:tetratricopeptide (TPR) repeat protein